MEGRIAADIALTLICGLYVEEGGVTGDALLAQRVPTCLAEVFALCLVLETL